MPSADQLMLVQISIGAPVLTINQSATFMVTDLTGEISGDGELGVLADDTRFVSYYAISANGEPWDAPDGERDRAQRSIRNRLRVPGIRINLAQTATIRVVTRITQTIAKTVARLFGSWKRNLA